MSIAYIQIIQFFWADAKATTCYIQNRTFLKTLEASMTFLTLYCGKTPHLSHLKIYGYITYVHIFNEYQHKLDIKNKKYIFFGYGE